MTPAYRPAEFAAVEACVARGACPELSIVVPTYCEAGNIAPLLAALEAALDGIAWEVIFVDDDSPDGTAAAIRQRAATDPRVRAIQRLGRRGLAGASIEGMLSSSAGTLAVMDCDLQHDETQIMRMLELIRAGSDLVVATRYQHGGTTGEGLTAARRNASRLATRLSAFLLGASVSDPMSGFFMIRRTVLENIAPRLSTAGFKILLDILASRSQPLKIAEVPYTFRPRHSGSSKLNELVAVEFLSLLISKATGDRISPRFFMFALVGATGVAIHLLALKAALGLAALAFGAAQIVASYTAMTWNFFLNNALTYRDRRLRGWQLITGLLSFCAVCSIGTIANIGVAQLVYNQDANWLIAGLAGALMAAVFNYAVTSITTWRK